MELIFLWGVIDLELDENQVKFSMGGYLGLDCMELGDNHKWPFFRTFSIQWQLIILGEPNMIPHSVFWSPSLVELVYMSIKILCNRAKSA